MQKTEVLVLNGSPGSGKSTIANAIADELRALGVMHAVIDVDELARIYPEDHMNMMWSNLKSIWPNYAKNQGIKAILPVCIDDQVAFDLLKEAVPCDVFTVCELTAQINTLLMRVSEREPNEYWQKKLRNLVQVYAERVVKFGDFQVNTEELTHAQTAKTIIDKLGWSVAG